MHWQAEAAQREAAEQTECTFRPKAAPLALVPADPEAYQPPVVVHGLNRFLERKVTLTVDTAHSWECCAVEVFCKS